MNRFIIPFLLITALPAIGACQTQSASDGAFNLAQATEPEMKPAKAEHVNMWEDVNEAVAVLHPTEGNDVRGTVHFRQDGEQVTVTAHVTGLEPGSTHAIHVHQYGDCTAPDGTSAGGHYNPDDHPHDLPPAEPRHAGDFGNLEANDQGEAHFEITVDNISVAGLKNPVMGRGMIVHAQHDTGEGDTGEAGARLACGVIGVANPGD